LYQGTRDGFGIDSFKSNIGTHTPFFFVIENEANYKFGGYTIISRNPSDGNWYGNDDSAFIFSLNNKTKHRVTRD
jgi:hypothetical protein